MKKKAISRWQGCALPSAAPSRSGGCPHCSPEQSLRGTGGCPQHPCASRWHSLSALQLAALHSVVLRFTQYRISPVSRDPCRSLSPSRLQQNEEWRCGARCPIAALAGQSWATQVRVSGSRAEVRRAEGGWNFPFSCVCFSIHVILTWCKLGRDASLVRPPR